MMYEIDVLFQEKFPTNDALDLIGSPAFYDIVVWLGHCFEAVTLPYLILIRSCTDIILFFGANVVYHRQKYYRKKVIIVGKLKSSVFGLPADNFLFYSQGLECNFAKPFY
jgi:hypothetical protein